MTIKIGVNCIAALIPPLITLPNIVRTPYLIVMPKENIICKPAVVNCGALCRGHIPLQTLLQLPIQDVQELMQQGNGQKQDNRETKTKSE